jgi:hypothetical protein
MERSKLQLASDLGSYFTSEVATAAKKQGLKMSEHACSYLALILLKFSQTEQLLVDNNSDEVSPSKTFPTLAKLWMDSLQSNPTEQFFKMQHLGDVALFTTGFFADRLDRRNIDMDYYFAMGENAYQRAGHLRETLAHESRINVYFELAEHFSKCSEVFAELADTALLRSEKDILKLYEKWLKTRNFRISRMLGEVGVITGVPTKKGDSTQFD